MSSEDVVPQVLWFLGFFLCYWLVLMGLGICARIKYGSVSAFAHRSKKSRYVAGALLAVMPVSMVLFMIYMFIAMIISGDG